MSGVTAGGWTEDEDRRALGGHGGPLEATTAAQAWTSKIWMKSEPVRMERLIKRYANRKMYDTSASRYVTLDGVADLVRAGEDLRIVDNGTGEDLTALIFAQIIFEEEKRKNGLLELPVLRWIIQRGGATVQEILQRVDRGREAFVNVRELAEKGVKQLLQGSESRTAEARAAKRHAAEGAGSRRLLEEILEVPQRQLEQLQHRIDAQVRASIERFTAHPAIQSELQRIEASVKSLERQLRRLRRGAARRQRRAKAKRTRTTQRIRVRG
jgi:polyhydroxyalkanoate synthesis repressor PhaR